MSTLTADTMTRDGLTVLEREILDFESGFGGALHREEKSAKVALLFDGMTLIQYVGVLGSLLDSDAAATYAPETVHRLREAAITGVERAVA